MTDEVKARLDKWLWAARFYRTRSLASTAIRGGKVQVNGNRIKASRLLNIHDQLIIHRGEEIFNLTVLGLTEQRRSASLARLLYLECPESISAREEARAQRKLLHNSVRYDRGRPTKSARRQARKIRRDPFRDI
ncbi:MAG TPA: RNA-binding S4 domain-containing protein [Gammaproteobacteria bacterium]|nr:RNA-binding S4 domain-containing protein [Gammaproteobacteria bacterium]